MLARWALLVVLISAIIIPAAGEAKENRFRFDIPSQEMGAALRIFARATSSQVAFDRATVKGVRSQALAATLTPDEALKQLLRGSGLVFTRSASGLFIVSKMQARKSKRRSVRPSLKTVISDSEPPKEILVTARKREERAIDIPIAVSATLGSDAERQGMRSIGDALSATPGVGAYSRGDGQQVISIRGISTSLGGNANGYYLDDAPFTGVTVPIEPDVRAWDLDRVEVLRGPQGTLFGEGSLGGTVRIITAAPDVQHWQAKGNAYVSGTDGGGINQGIKAAFNIPMIRDVLAIRVAGTHEVLPGWVDDDATGRSNLNTQRYDTLRSRITIKPFAGVTFGGTYWFYKVTNPSGGSAATDDGQSSRSTALSSRMAYRQYAANARYEAGAMVAFYGYSHTAFSLPQAGRFLGGELKSTIAIAIDTHEARLASTRGGPLQWTIGSYLRNARRRDMLDFSLLGLVYIGHTTNSAKAVFGEVTYTLPEVPVDLSVGLRLYTERVSGIQTDYGQAINQPGESYNSWNPRASVAWHPTAESTLYTSVAKGFRAGQLQPTYSIGLASLEGVSLPLSLKQDSIWTYEIGGKAELLDGRLFIDVALYHSDWRNVAVRLPIGSSGFNGLVNSSGTRTDGAEMALTFRPHPALSITSSASFINARYKSSIPGTSIDRGQPVDEVPKFTGSLVANYRHDIGHNKTAFITTGWRHNSPRAFKSFSLYQDGDVIDVIDARLGLEIGRGSVAVFADNLTNEGGALTYRIVQPLLDGTTDITSQRLRPRTIGLELSFRLGGGS